MNDLAIETIKRYGDETLFEPDKQWPKYWFEYRAYSRWAVNEILESVMNHPLVPAYETIFEFSLKSVCYAQAANDRARFIFSVAADVANDILDMLQ